MPAKHSQRHFSLVQRLARLKHDSSGGKEEPAWAKCSGICTSAKCGESSSNFGHKRPKLYNRPTLQQECSRQRP